MSDRKFMLLALEEALKSVRKCQTPFGACIVKDGKVVSAAHNTVWSDTDSTAHAEVNAIRRACKKLKTIDLSDCTIYSSCEPCPMCFSAIHWACINKIIYGTATKDAKKIGFNELGITDRRLKSLGKSKVKIIPDFMREECLSLLKRFNELPNKRLY
ncbi:MAG: nucleoside deaminase [Candidatus Altiarchaeota archaeon]|nr:nucleoside deaminase [Candidatus Altiarchaeota archaeon]